MPSALDVLLSPFSSPLPPPFYIQALAQTLDYNFTSTSPSQCSLPSEPKFSIQWLWIYENHIYVNCGLNNEYESDLCSNEHNLSSREKWKLGLKKSGLNCFQDLFLPLLK